MAERFQEQTQLRQVDIRTGAQQGLISVADKLEQFQSGLEDIAIRKLSERATKRGIESAGQVELQKVGGVTQQPELKDVPLFFGQEAVAHNKALRSAYFASIGNDNREAIARLSAENSDDIIGFNDATEGYKKGMLKGVDPSARQAVAEDIDNRTTSARIKIQANEIKKQQQIARDEIETATLGASSDAARDARNGDMQSATENTLQAFSLIDQAVEAGFVLPGQAKEAKREIERETAEQTLRREFDIVADENIEKASALVEEKRRKVPKGWTPDEWDTYLTSQNQEINRKKANLTKDLKATQKLIDDQESLRRGQQFMDPDIPADPATSGQDRKDVNRAFEEFATGLAGMSGAEQIVGIEDFVINTGIIPDALISKSSASMRSGNPVNVLVFSTVINDLANSANPSVLRDLPTQTRAVALQIKSSSDAGLDIETSIEVARKNVYGLTEIDKKRIALETQAIRPELPTILNDVIDKHFDPFFFTAQPDITPAFQADFNVAFESFMTLTDGNSEQSTLLATETLVKNWGLNDIDGGERLMKFAPSVYYSVPGVDDDWMEDQFKSDVSPFGDVDNFRIGINIDSINSGQPTYPVMNVDPSGIIQPVFDDEGNMLEWAPDFAQTREYKELKALPGKKLQEGIELKRKADRLKEILGQKEESII